MEKESGDKRKTDGFCLQVIWISIITVNTDLFIKGLV